MKKILMAIIAIMIIFYSAVSAEAAKKVVAVMPLENISGQDTAKVAEIMTEKFIVALQNSGQYSVLERDQMAAVLREQGFQNLTADPNSTVEMGKLFGANYLLVGKVTTASVIENNPLNNVLSDEDFLDNTDEEKSIKILQGLLNQTVTGKVSVDIRFVNNETGELIFAKSFTGSKTDKNEENTLAGACQEIADNFLKEITSNLTGRVVDTSDDEIYIDLGLDSGLKTGDELLIVRETSPIEINGKIVGMKTVSVGKIKVVEIYEEYSICKVISVKNGMFVTKGDVIKRGR